MFPVSFRCTGAKTLCTIALIGLQGAFAANAQAVEIELAVTKATPSSYNSKITITNNEAAEINGWTLSFTLGNQIKSSYGSTRTGADPYTFTNASYNGKIAVGANKTIGFTANGTLNAGQVGHCSFNGKACTIKLIGAGASSSSQSSSSSSSSAASSSSSSSSSAPSSSSSSSSSISSSSSSSSRPSNTSGFVSTNGALRVSGNQLVNKDGSPIQLRGMSSHGLQWDVNILNGTTTTWLKEDWKANVVRAAMYIEEGGYKTNSNVKYKLYEIVDSAIANDIYVIVDWHILHDNNPQTNKALAKDFFEEVSKKYGNIPNIIYEIANEPNGNVTWNNDIRPYAEEVIPVIRNNAKDSVVIVGTGTWSQDVHDAAAKPLTLSNVGYTVHFYACTHGQWLRDRVAAAMTKGVMIFATEWGTADASGGGSVCEPQTNEWISFLNQKKISWVNWSVSNKNEATAAFKPGSNTTTRWTDSNLSTSGVLVKKLMAQ